MAALVLLIKQNSHKIIPFFPTLDGYRQNKELLVESNLVESLLCNLHVPADLHKKNIKELIEYYNKTFDFSQSNYQEYKDLFWRQADEIKKTSPMAAEVSHIVPDLAGLQSGAQSLEPLRAEDLSETDLWCTGFKPQMLTIVPSPLPLRDDEVNSAKSALLPAALHNRWTLLGTS